MVQQGILLDTHFKILILDNQGINLNDISKDGYPNYGYPPK